MTRRQPDEAIPKYYDNEFNDLDEKLTPFSYTQSDNTVFYSSFYSGLRSPPTESLALNNLNDIPSETSSVEHLSEFDIPLFPGFQLRESSMDPFDDPDPISEYVATTTTSDVESNNNNNTPSELNSIRDVTQPAAEIVPERINLKLVDPRIQEQLISVLIHPEHDPRRRYKSEGRRRIKKLPSNLLTLDLSQLQKYTLNPDQVPWLRLSLITHSDDPLVGIFIHPDKLTFLSDGDRLGIDGSVLIRITQSHIDDGKIELKDLSIIKKLDNTYNFKLIPYSMSTIDDESETYVIDETKTTAGNAKVFRKQYNVIASRIACQILIEEDGSYILTYITCKTNVMIEERYQSKTTKPTKRLVKKDQKLGEKRRNTIKPKSVKRKKCSNC